MLDEDHWDCSINYSEMPQFGVKINDMMKSIKIIVLFIVSEQAFYWSGTQFTASHSVDYCVRQIVKW